MSFSKSTQFELEDEVIMMERYDASAVNDVSDGTPCKLVIAFLF